MLDISKRLDRLVIRYTRMHVIFDGEPDAYTASRRVLNVNCIGEAPTATAALRDLRLRVRKVVHARFTATAESLRATPFHGSPGRMDTTRNDRLRLRRFNEGRAAVRP